MFFEGVAGIVAGSLLLGTLRQTIPLLLRFLGIYWLTAGVASFLWLVLRRRREHWFLLLLRGLLGTIGGLAALLWQQLITVSLPAALSYLQAALIITTTVGVIGVLVGVVGLVQAVRGAGWGAGVLGLLSIGFGGLLFNYQPTMSRHLFNGLGVVALTAGVLGVLFAFVRRNGMEAGVAAQLHVRDPVLAVLRLLAVLVMLPAGVAVTFVLWLVPLKRHGLRWHHWSVMHLCRLLLAILQVRVVCHERVRLLTFHGLLFCNHLSYLDILVIGAQAPVRFLSSAELLRVPFVGWVAQAISTIFVSRSDRDARRTVRRLIAEHMARHTYPPFVIFPEGRFGTSERLAPFRYGSFEVAAQNRLAYLLCSLRYEPHAVACWRGRATEHFLRAFWRLLTYRRPISAELTPLAERRPQPDDDHVQLAHAAEVAIAAGLGVTPS